MVLDSAQLQLPIISKYPLDRNRPISVFRPWDFPFYKDRTTLLQSMLFLAWTLHKKEPMLMQILLVYIVVSIVATSSVKT